MKDRHTTKQAAEILGLAQRTVRDYALQGKIRSFKIGNRTLFTDEMLEEYLSQGVERAKK